MRRGAILGNSRPDARILSQDEEEDEKNDDLQAEKRVSIELPSQAKTFDKRRRDTIAGKTHTRSRQDSFFHAGALDAHRNSFSGVPPGLRRKSLATPSRNSSQKRYSVAVPKDDKDIGIDDSKLTPASEALTRQQKLAFREAFDLFDSNGGGTIDALELKKTLESVGILLEEEEIHDVMMRLDKDGNGEIDFEEFLNMMTNTEMFLEAFAAKHGEKGTLEQRDILLFDALTEFMKKSALSEAHEIVGYYAKTYKKAVKSYNKNKGAHVVSHYADGARLIGLTEKQLIMQLRKLTMCQNFGNEGEKSSPYAQPLHSSMLRSITAHTVTKRRKKKKVPPRKESFACRQGGKILADVTENQQFKPVAKEPSTAGSGKIKLKIINNSLLRKAPILEENDKITQKHGKSSKEKDWQHKPGWLSQRNKMYNVEIPMPVKYRDVQVDQINNLREKVKEAKDKFSDDIAAKKIEHTLNHYAQLDSRKIQSEPLHKQFQKVFCAYSSAESNNRTALTVKQLQAYTKVKNH